MTKQMYYRNVSIFDSMNDKLTQPETVSIFHLMY